MGVLAYMKLLMPLAFDVLREVLLPGTKEGVEKKTTVLERLCILSILLLFALLYFTGEQLYVINDAKVTAEKAVMVLQEKNIALNDKIDTLKKADKASKLVIADLRAKPVILPAKEVEQHVPTPQPDKNKTVKNRHRMLYDKLNKKD